MASTGTAARTVSSPRAAARPRSTSSGGAMPRDSERSSSTVSRAWSSASSRVCAGQRGVVLQLLLRPAEVHLEPDQPLLRARRGCRARAGAGRRPRPCGRPARPPSTRRTSCWSSARLLRSRCARPPCRAAANRDDERQRDQRDRADDQHQQALRVAAVTEAGAARDGDVVVRVVGDPALPEPVGQPAEGQRPPRERQGERDRAGHQPDEAPQHVEPRLRVAQRGQRLAPEGGALGRAEVRRGRGRLAEHPAQPHPLEPREAAGHHHRDPEQQHPADQHRQPEAQREVDDDDDERRQGQEERRQRVAGVQQHPADAAAAGHRRGSGRAAAPVVRPAGERSWSSRPSWLQRGPPGARPRACQHHTGCRGSPTAVGLRRVAQRVVLPGGPARGPSA